MSARRFTLGLAAAAQRVVSVPGRLLDLAGLELFTGKGYSEQWASLGVLVRKSPLHGFWMMLDARYSNQRLAYVLGEPADRSLTRFLCAHLRDGQVFVDIGANIGMFTLVGSRLVGATGRVIAFEPNPSSFQVLQAHLALNRVRQAVAHPWALGRTSATTDLYLGDSESPLASLRPDERLDRVSVTVVRGDDVLVDVPPEAAGVCKIDVEGFEFEAVLGLEGFVRTHPAFLYCIEVTDEWMQKASGCGIASLFEFFDRLGFHPSVITRDGQLEPITAPPGGFQHDIVFSRAA